MDLLRLSFEEYIVNKMSFFLGSNNAYNNINMNYMNNRRNSCNNKKKHSLMNSSLDLGHKAFFVFFDTPPAHVTIWWLKMK